MAGSRKLSSLAWARAGERGADPGPLCRRVTHGMTRPFVPVRFAHFRTPGGPRSAFITAPRRVIDAGSTVIHIYVACALLEA